MLRIAQPAPMLCLGSSPDPRLHLSANYVHDLNADAAGPAEPRLEIHHSHCAAEFDRFWPKKRNCPGEKWLREASKAAKLSEQPAPPKAVGLAVAQIFWDFDSHQ